MFAIEDIIDLAIQIEESGEKVYRNAAEKTSNPSLISLLQWLADEEVKHAKWFMELKHDVQTSGGKPFVQEMGRDLIKDFMGDQSFSLREVDFSEVHQPDELIDIFIEFEEDSILFYEMLKPFIQDENILADLESIIAEEKQHIEQLQEFSKTPMREENG